jgi:thymidine kinase
MSSFTEEQLKYINNPDKDDTKLLACAGSGKTKCIIGRIMYLIQNKMYDMSEILVLTFSRFTQQDFIHRLNQIDREELVCRDNVSTIDSFAKRIIDKEHKIDVSLLSYKFMKYLVNTDIEILKQNKDLLNYKTIFIDEAQDLNPTQYSILINLKNKLNINLNLIGDPNQNIYQFRGSSDKYLREYVAKEFVLTMNFRSHKQIVDFSKELRPIQSEVCAFKSNLNILPQFIFVENERQIEQNLVELIKIYQEQKINLKDVAILSPVRGRMKGFGKSNGLCLVTNILSKHNIKFKQFYDENKEEESDKVEYKPQDSHINILTYIGSKGLEWKHVILVDADVCLINKSKFDLERHKNDQYLLYVACSRAIEGMFIFTTYTIHTTSKGTVFKINPWFQLIPPNLYEVSEGFENIKYPELEFKNDTFIDASVTKIISKFNEETLDYLSNIIGYETSMVRENKKMFKYIQPDTIQSTSFLGQYTEAIFHISQSILKNTYKKRYYNIEKIIYAQKIIFDANRNITNWYENASRLMNWTQYEIEKNTNRIDKDIIDYVEKKFDKSCDFSKHLLVNDPYFNISIIKRIDKIKKKYESYLSSRDFKQLKKDIFYIILVLHSIDTHHYFHVDNKGINFKNILESYDPLFNLIFNYVKNSTEIFDCNSGYIFNYDLKGEVDIIDENDEYVEIKCVKDIGLKHVLQLLVYNIMKLGEINKEIIYKFNLRFFNFLKGEEVKIQIETDKVSEIIELFINNIKS